MILQPLIFLKCNLSHAGKEGIISAGFEANVHLGDEVEEFVSFIGGTCVLWKDGIFVERTRECSSHGRPRAGVGQRQKVDRRQRIIVQRMISEALEQGANHCLGQPSRK